MRRRRKERKKRLELCVWGGGRAGKWGQGCSLGTMGYSHKKMGVDKQTGRQ